MMYASVLISREKLVVRKHFSTNRPQELVLSLKQLMISSYHMEEETLGSLA